MYNIHSHYNNIFNYVKNKIKNPKLGYFFPFGSSQVENLEFIGSSESEIFLLCHDQEPLVLSFNRETLEKYKKITQHEIYQPVFNEITYYSKTFNQIISYRVNSFANYTIRSFENYGVNSFVKTVPTILLNTEKDSNQKDKILKEFDFVDCYYFYHALAAADWYRGYQYCFEITPIRSRKIIKKFITFNRITGSSRIYRAFFVAKLFEKNLLDCGHISFSKNCPVHGDITNQDNTLNEYSIDKKFYNKMMAYVLLLPELRIDGQRNEPILNSSFIINAIHESLESFVHVVTETCFWEEKKHLTEKIFKPIVLKQPFILLGCANNLAYLKEYGFKTFDRWWDESYDQCQDPIKRIDMVIQILEKLCKLSNNKLQEMLIEMEEILEYNYSLFYSQKFIDGIWNELKTNLNTAIAQVSHQTVQGTSIQNHLYTAENKSLA
jgi:hypothetical protein